MTTPFLAVNGVSKSFALGETRVHALSQVDLHIARGEFCALVGPSGSGKSTLLHIFGCIDTPDAGEVIVDGQGTTALDEVARSRLRNRKVGFIFQSFNLISVLNVRENVELPLSLQPELSKSERKRRAEQCLAEVGMAHKAEALPDKLSGGERQRVAIARALVTEPSLVLADEPTANLDSENTTRVIDLMLDLNQRRAVTFLFSTHDASLMARVKRTVHIKDGRLLP